MAAPRAKKSSPRKPLAASIASSKKLPPKKTAIQHAISRDIAGVVNKAARMQEVRDRKVARGRTKVLQGLGEICDALKVDAERRGLITAAIEKHLAKLAKPRRAPLTPAQVAAL